MNEIATERRMATTDFQTLHAKINPDPVIELNRRLQMWASVPDSDGGALSPSAAIVPDETIAAVLAEISKLKSQLEEARADRDAHKRDAARVLEQLGKGLDDQIDAVRAAAIEECARISDGYYSEDNECSKDIRALLNGSAK